MKIRLLALLWLVSLLIGLSGCSSNESNQPEASLDPVQRGKVLSEMNMIGENKAPSCIVCHSLEPNKTLVKPSLARMATYAQFAVPGMSAA